MGGPFDKLFNSDFGKTATFLEKGMNMVNPIDPNLSDIEKRSANTKRSIVSLLGSAAINFLPKLAGMKDGGVAVKQRMKLMPVPFLDEPVYMNLGGVATKKQMAHNNQLMKLGGDVKGKL